jgi:nickel-type superoxide dismutase maturation protease
MLSRLLALLPVGRYRVEGESMSPGLQPGERVVVNRLAYWLREPRPGDVVVLRDPRQRDRLLVKRIEARDDDGRWLVAGDNAAASTDSRAFGLVERALILGKVWFRY